MQAIIALDIGTTSMRALLYDATGQVRHIVQRDNRPVAYRDGRVEQDAASWVQLLPDLLKNCVEAAQVENVAVQCISMTAQRSSVIPIDPKGQALYPAMMWQDRRSAALAKSMNAEQTLVYHKTGLRISPVYSAIKMRWLAENEPEIWRKTYKLIGVQDWVLYQLTGRLVTDHTFASRTNLFNLISRQWDDELLDLFGIHEHLLCELVTPGSIIGGLGKPLAEASGLPQGLPVVTAGGDQQCAALGLGLFAARQAICNTGTGSFVITHSDVPVFDPAMRLSCNMSALPGKNYIVEAAVQTSGATYRWFGEMIAGIAGGAGELFKTLDEEAAKAQPGANGVLFLPHFKGSGAPYWDTEAKGLWYGLTLATSRGDMARAVLEGIAMEMANGLDALEALCGQIDTMTVAGGMSRSALFNQIQSNVFARTITRLAHEEATAFGAWLSGSVACGFDQDIRSAFTRVMAEQAAPSSYTATPELQAIYTCQRTHALALYRSLTAARESFS